MILRESGDHTEARRVAGFGPGHCVGSNAALIGFYPGSVLEPPGLNRSSFPGRAAFPVCRTISGSFGRNQCFCLAAQDVRFQPVVEVQP